MECVHYPESKFVLNKHHSPIDGDAFQKTSNRKGFWYVRSWHTVYSLCNCGMLFWGLKATSLHFNSSELHLVGANQRPGTQPRISHKNIPLVRALSNWGETQKQVITAWYNKGKVNEEQRSSKLPYLGSRESSAEGMSMLGLEELRSSTVSVHLHSAS